MGSIFTFRLVRVCNEDVAEIQIFHRWPALPLEGRLPAGRKVRKDGLR